MSRLHPATVVTIAACGWILTLALNTPVASASVMLVALASGTVSTRNASVILTTLALSVPAALSMLVIHAPYGDTPVAPLLTADGLMLAGSLSLRFCALMACFIAAMAALRIADIAKWLQISRAGHKVAYVVGSSLQTLPQGAHAWRCVREANQLAGITITWRNTISRVIIPVIARLLIQGTQRGQALAAIGFDQEGQRSLLRPVADSRLSRVLRFLIPLVCLAVVIARWI